MGVGKMRHVRNLLTWILLLGSLGIVAEAGNGGAQEAVVNVDNAIIAVAVVVLIGVAIFIWRNKRYWKERLEKHHE